MPSDLFPACDPAVRSELARAHWPEGMAFDDAHERLLARGWPHLTLLVDDDPRDRKPEVEAWKVLQSLDPVISVHWPREVAKRFVHAFALAGTPKGAEFDVKNGGKGESKRFHEALAITGDPTREEAETIVRASVATLSAYPFHFRDAAFILETFLGSEVMAEIVVSRIEALTPAEWRHDNLHNRFFETLFALECFLLRSDRASAEAHARRLRAAYAGRPSPDGPSTDLVARRLAVMIDGTSAYVENRAAWLYNLPFLTADAAFVPSYLEHPFASWLLTPQLLRIAGPGIATPRVLAGMRRDGPWKQLERATVFAPIRHPVIVELFAGMVGSKGAKGRPEAWLSEHLDYARPTLERLIAAGHPQAAALSAIAAGHAAAAAKAKSAAKVKPLSSKQLEAKIGTLFERLIADVTRVRGSHEEEARIWRDGTHALIELRVAAGDAVPNERVGHAFGVDGWGKHEAPMNALKATAEESDRWFEAVDAASDG